MEEAKNNPTLCAICGQSFALRDLVPGHTVRDVIAREIEREYPQWKRDSFICPEDLNRIRSRYVHSLVESEKGELTTLERDVLRSLQDHELLSKNIEQEFEHDWTFSERLADQIAVFGGSWVFLSWFAGFLLIWIALNSLTFWWQPADPYPYILLNLVLSCLASVQAPFIMMSQNRKEAKDRLRSQHDYQVNLKAELEIRQLHEKIDHLLLHQWERLAQIQEVQMELLSELGKRKPTGAESSSS